MLRYPLSFLFLYSFFTTFSQEKWDLEKCIKYAQENNLQIKQTQLSQQAANNLKKESVANLFPNLNSSATYGFNFGRSIDPTTYSFVNQKIQTSSLSLTSSLTLLNGLNKINTIKQTKFDAMASQY